MPQVKPEQQKSVAVLHGPPSSWHPGRLAAASTPAPASVLAPFSAAAASTVAVTALSAAASLLIPATQPPPQPAEKTGIPIPNQTHRVACFIFVLLSRFTVRISE